MIPMMKKEKIKTKYYQPIMKLKWYESIKNQMEKWKDTKNEYYKIVLGEINVAKETKKVKTIIKGEEND